MKKLNWKKNLIIAAVALGISLLVFILITVASPKKFPIIASKPSSIGFSDSTDISSSSTASVDQSYLNKEPTHPGTNTTSSTTDQKSSVSSSKSSSSKSDTSSVANVDSRRPTGDGKTLSFSKGDTVLGAAILINGKTFTNAVIKNAPMGGSVTSGVISPWASEMNGLTVISNDEILSAPVSSSTPSSSSSSSSSSTSSSVSSSSSSTPSSSSSSSSSSTSSTKTRTPTGVGQTKDFQVGDTIVGYSITINGRTFSDPNGVVIYNAPFGGTVTDGVINPWSTEITNQKVITNDQIS
jgi:hypothetical protein